ncbi:hypothetical protein QE152_g22798 [Popillia japonica]|uniref:Uncharacterized protein n=1 Tax=Popillia japonica TaxID=7064 RepID=A0AAW1KHH6_POPJA
MSISFAKAQSNPFAHGPVEEMQEWIEINKHVPAIEELSDEKIIESVSNPQEIPVLDVKSEDEEAATQNAATIS